MIDPSKLPTHIVGMMIGFSMGLFGLILVVISLSIKVSLSIITFISFFLLVFGGSIMIAAIPLGLFFWFLYKLKVID
jgi:hypothetical protein